MPERFDRVRSWDAYTTHRDPVLTLFAGYEIANAKDPESLIFAQRTVEWRRAGCNCAPRARSQSSPA